MALSQVVDTNTDSKIFQNAIVRKFDYSAPIGTGFGFGDAERWLADYWNVLVNTLQAFNKRRVADERVSLKLLIEQLCELWERETQSQVTAHGIVKDVYASRPVTAAGRFVVAAVKAMLPDASWFADHNAQSIQARTFQPGYEPDRERHILEIMKDFVRRREKSA